jgi:hypothetical protein
MMKTVGMDCGVVIGVSVAFIIAGIVGKKVQ